VAVPRAELVRKLFENLLLPFEGVQVRDLLAQLEKATVLTDYERGHYANQPSASRLDKMLRFATIAEIKADWLCLAAFAGLCVFA